MSASILPTDPLAALGASLFLNVLASLPFETLAAVPSVCQSWLRLTRQHHSSIWRAACYRADIDPAKLQRLAEWSNVPAATAGSATEADWHPDYIRPGYPPPTTKVHHEGKVDWKEVCKRHIVEDRNWREGRCRNRWIYPPDDERTAVWRFKIDDEENTCIMTTDDVSGGLHVVDLTTSESLFALPDVRNHAHLEFCKGFVIFDAGSMGDHRLQVYMTRSALARSASRNQSDPGTATSIKARDRQGSPIGDTSPSQMARGALAYDRTINPPTQCIAFRARLDGEGTARERAVLVAAGEEAVYIWDLEESDSSADVIELGGEVGGVCYVDFDDSYVFITTERQIHVYSRSTKQSVFAYPPSQRQIPLRTTELCAVLYRVDAAGELYKALPRRSDIDAGVQLGKIDEQHFMPEEYRAGRAASIGRATAVGYAQSDPAFEAMMRAGLDDLFPAPPRTQGGYHDFEWTACHCTPTNLICVSLIGAMVITRNYASVLSIPDPVERARRWQEQTIIITLGCPISHLAVDGSHVTATAERDYHIFFDTRTLPNLPIQPDTALPGALTIPPIQVHAMLDTQQDALTMRNTSCAQIQRSTIYHVYCMVADQGGRPDFNLFDLDSVGRRRCIRGWDFAP